jgi:hypothetical protein
MNFRGSLSMLAACFIVPSHLRFASENHARSSIAGSSISVVSAIAVPVIVPF